MEETCRRAIEYGIPGLAFTDHADFVKVFDDQHPLDVAGYLECIERCRAKFPELKILSGVELGEPHRYPAETLAVLGAGRLDRVLGSVHCIRPEGVPRDLSQGIMTVESAAPVMRVYFQELLDLLESNQSFEIIAHLDYGKRYWPHRELPFREQDFEEEYRGLLRAAARRGSVLEVNTTRGAEPRRGLCPGPVVLGWWREEGGGAVCFGSDAHEAAKIAAGFAEAAAAVEAAGFRPAADPTAFWLR